jgi:putative ABC transport system permease protein
MQDPGEQMNAQSVIVTPEYYRTAGIKVVNGRAFTTEDTPGAPAVTIINETLARHLFPSENPVGQQLEIAASQWPDPDTVPPWTAEIVGVVADNKQWGATELPHDVFDVPFAQCPAPSMFVLAKTHIHSAALIDSIRGIVSKIDPDQPVYDIQLMTDRIRSSDLERRFNATLLVFFAATALLATAIGIYSTVAFWVTQRTHEIGVRMALGANRRQVFSLIAGNIARLIVIGVTFGLPAALGIVRLIRSFVYGGQAPADLFYGVSSLDPITVLAVLGALVGSAAIATTFPAWRATQIDPARALQAE